MISRLIDGGEGLMSRLDCIVGNRYPPRSAPADTIESICLEPDRVTPNRLASTY